MSSIFMGCSVERVNAADDAMTLENITLVNDGVR